MHNIGTTERVLPAARKRSAEWAVCASGEGPSGRNGILDICATVPVHFVIADGIIAMEGNGPLNGTPTHLGKIVLSSDPVAADATCARLMRFEPSRIPHIREASRFLGNSSIAAIDQVGETLTPPDVPFQVVPDWEYLHYFV